MSLVIAPVGYSVLDRGVFSQAARDISGRNYVGQVDKEYHLSKLAEDAAILGAFAGEDSLAFASLHLSLLVAGGQFNVGSFIEACRGMAHAGCREVSPDVRACIITGNLDQWKVAVLYGCKPGSDPIIRKGFNRVHSILSGLGFPELFSGASVVPQPDSTYFLK